MPSRVVLVVLAALAVCPVLADELTKAKPGLHAEAVLPPRHAVDVADDLALQDAARQKSVPYKVYFPAAGGPHPVIVFSHGFGANKDAFAEAGRHWASHGYVVIHPSHADGLGRRSHDADAADQDGPQRARQGRLLLGLTDTSWSALGLPMMAITGSRDRGVGGHGVEWKKEPYQLSPPGDKYLVVIEAANHFSFGGRLGARSAGVTTVVIALSTHFWDAYLKESEVSKQYLQSDRPAQESGAAYEFEWK